MTKLEHESIFTLRSFNNWICSSSFLFRSTIDMASSDEKIMHELNNYNRRTYFHRTVLVFRSESRITVVHYALDRWLSEVNLLLLSEDLAFFYRWIILVLLVSTFRILFSWKDIECNVKRSSLIVLSQPEIERLTSTAEWRPVRKIKSSYSSRDWIKSVRRFLNCSL